MGHDSPDRPAILDDEISFAMNVAGARAFEAFIRDQELMQKSNRAGEAVARIYSAREER